MPAGNPGGKCSSELLGHKIERSYSCISKTAQHVMSRESFHNAITKRVLR